MIPAITITTRTIIISHIAGLIVEGGCGVVDIGIGGLCVVLTLTEVFSDGLSNNELFVKFVTG